MVLSNFIKVKTNTKNQENKYISLGYKCVNGEYEIHYSHLPKRSNVKIDVKCDICENIYQIKYSSLKNRNICKSCVYKIGQTDESIQQRVLKINITKKNNAEKDSLYWNKIQKKCAKTNLEKYQSVNNQDKKRETSLKKYGFSSYNNQEKKKKTCLERYGVEHQTQVDAFFEKQQKSSFLLKSFNDINYRGSYELDFLIFCEKYNINVQKSPTFFYETDKKHKYYPDFYIKELNLIVEIKSLYTYEVNKEVNEIKKQSCIFAGFNFIFIIDKNYNDLMSLLKNKTCI